MSLFDQIKGQLGNIAAAETAGAEGAKSDTHDPHAMLDGVVGLITQHGGVTGLLDKLKSGGLADAASTWVGSGANQSVTAEQVEGALGPQVIDQICAKTGIPKSMAGPLLSQYLPMVIDHLTPGGSVEAKPSAGWLETGIGLLKSQLLKPKA